MKHVILIPTFFPLTYCKIMSSLVSKQLILIRHTAEMHTNQSENHDVPLYSYYTQKCLIKLF